MHKYQCLLISFGHLIIDAVSVEGSMFSFYQQVFSLLKLLSSWPLINRTNKQELQDYLLATFG